MSEPRIEFIPLRAGVNKEAESTLDLIVRVTPPALEGSGPRPPANLSLVIDRSGSMSGEKIEYARRAAIAALDQLCPEDRVSVVAFDEHIEVVVPSSRVSDRDAIARAIHGIDARGTTALHGGWMQGGTQVAAHLKAEALNRVILFTDGQANVGETNTDTIAAHVRGLQERGVSTSTYGIGRDFNEDLLVAMAQAGDGNFEFISDPATLPALFQAELQGLKATFGRQVSLGLEPQSGVTVLDALNDYRRNQYGRLMLPNLTAGHALDSAFRLKVPPFAANSELLRVRLAWDDPRAKTRRKLRASLTLPAYPASEYEQLPQNEEVSAAVAVLLAAREKLEFARSVERGDLAAARLSNQRARDLMAPVASSPAAAYELADLDTLDASLDQGDAASARKHAFSQRFDRQSSKPRRNQ